MNIEKLHDLLKLFDKFEIVDESHNTDSIKIDSDAIEVDSIYSDEDDWITI